MTASSDPTVDDDTLLAQWFDRFVEDVLDGRATDLEAIVEERPDLESRIHESYLLAHQLAGRRLPTTPRVEGYEIEREIGRGGMGAVFLARRADSDRPVALKVLPTSFGLSDRARTRFLTEARALAQVSDDHIVRVFNVIANDEALAFEMEYVDGPSLRDVSDRLRQKGREATLSDVVAILGDPAARPAERTLLQWCVRVVATIARALGKVHRAGLVHRDVKPSNILLRRDGTPLLADFGLVRDLAATATRTEAFVGTLAYASPEQLRAEGEDSDARSDVYSIGATLWELVTGTPPVEGRSTVEILERLAVAGAPRLRRVLPDAPRDLETILEKAMDPDPAQRYQTVDALADDLDLLLRWRPIQARPPSTLRRVSRRIHRQRRVLAAGLIGAGVVATAISVPLVLERQRESAAREAAALVRTAHESLISAAIRDRVFRLLALGAIPQGELLTALSEERPQGLSAALDAYDRALALVPDVGDAAVERTLVRIAMGSGATRGRNGSRHFDLDSLPTNARLYAQPWAHDIPRTLVRLELSDTTVDERHAIGLLAFLVGDLTNCETAWSRLDPIATHKPLTDAGLGLLYAVDGQPERAYPRLVQATRSFPDNPLLATTLAEVAVALGDLDLAERWLRRARELEATDLDVSLVEADLLAARGELAAARAGLVDQDPSDPRVGLRIAAWEREAGDADAAARRLTTLLEEYPRTVRARLGLARAALDARDTATYLAQVEWIVADGYCAHRSAGTALDAVATLRLGGLHDLAARANEANGPGATTSRRGWVEASFTKAPFADPARIEDLVLRRYGAERDRHVSFPRPPISTRLGRLASLLAHGVSAWTWFPELGSAAGATRQAAGFALQLGVRRSWPTIVQEVLPALSWSRERIGFPESHAVFAVAGDAAHDMFGRTARAGDVDGDGVEDFAVGTLRESLTPDGYMRLTSGADGTVLRELRGPGAGLVGAVVGDVDGDGHTDFAHTSMAPADGGLLNSLVRIVSTVDERVLLTLSDTEPNSDFGTSIVGFGDVDADGCDDICISSMGPTNGTGFVRGYSGRTGAELFTVRGSLSELFGCAVAAVEDRDGDGVRDVLVGAFGAERARGRAWVLSTRTGERLLELAGDPDDAMFGVSVTGGGDVDGDGVEDFLVGAIAGREPSAVLLSGASGSVLWTGRGATRTDSLGWSVALCDLDGDGIVDPIASAAMADSSGPRSGLLVAWSGRSIRDGGAVAKLLELRGRGPGDMFGGSVTALPDHFGPGLGAIVVSAPGLTTDVPERGGAWLLSPTLGPDEAARRLAARR